MHRSLVVVLAALVLVSWFAAAGWSAPPEVPVFEVEPLIVTASKYEERAADALAAVSLGWGKGANTTLAW